MKVEIDINALHERTADDNDLALDLLEMLKSAESEYHENIIFAINESNLNAFAAELHKIKSVVAILGFDKLAENISDVEKNALEKSEKIDYTSEINRIFISLNNHIIELDKYLKK